MNVPKLLTYSIWGLWQKRVTHLPPEQLRRLQEKRFRRTLRLAGERSAFYRHKDRGLDTARCGLAALPTTNKTELMPQLDEVVSGPRSRRAEVAAYMQDPDNALNPYLRPY